ncbi:GNAT family N-acetyltransferase [Rossellomorea sp. YZS02]|uniref:GNAT family N-acetyltransferase n=1 Tax=Rossellomorea sp. YZS02 TaxID=3097358 RepID=UPI002A0FDDD4|nr:GNAT family N-acetyltransferase [Rossellomorea sp. YZS02]MDX8344962.1 GNAT family N-acetyltransferase [Rossellomorea sp. YZS02]
MSIHYSQFRSLPEDQVVNGLVTLHQSIFGASDDLITKMASKPEILIDMAMFDSRVIGYKIGYELDPHTFYSWLGGVDPDYRKQGIAAELMKRQHHTLKELRYMVVQTKTMNKWRSMLILNIKNGFDVIDTYTNEKGLHKIILEKKL